MFIIIIIIIIVVIIVIAIIIIIISNIIINIIVKIIYWQIQIKNNNIKLYVFLGRFVLCCHHIWK